MCVSNGQRSARQAPVCPLRSPITRVLPSRNCSWKACLRADGVSLVDLGTPSAEPADYTDYAHAVAEAVAARKSEFGLLICTTGVGMSMAANKIPGVRAALVADEHTAALARQHNNANVLCLGGQNHPAGAARKILDAFPRRPIRGRPPRTTH